MLRFQVTASALADYHSLSHNQRELFKTAVGKFNDGADRFVSTGHPSSWPKALRVKSVARAPGVFEMTWSLAGPDRRATWEWASVSIEGKSHPAVRWRRIGDHRILFDP